MNGNDRKRTNLGLALDLDFERCDEAMPRQLDLAELETVEGGNPMVIGAGIALAGFACGAVVGVAAGVAIGLAATK